MQIRFGVINAYDVTYGVSEGLAKYAANNAQSPGLPVQLQANDQFTRLDNKLERIATAVEKMANNYGRT